jgi:predicted RNA-binding protein YlxR (DUF448 family)
VVCGQAVAQDAMLRFVRDADGSARPDPERREPGRGAYLCQRLECAQAVRDGRALSRSLRAQVTVDQETLDFTFAWQRDASTR